MNIKEFLEQYLRRVLACCITPIQLQQRELLKSPAMLPTATGPQQFAGLTALASGTAFATISTAVVNSDSLILATFQVNTTTVSGFAFATGVSSIVTGVSFAFGFLDGIGRAPGGTIMWELRRTS